MISLRSITLEWAGKYRLQITVSRGGGGRALTSGLPIVGFHSAEVFDPPLTDPLTPALCCTDDPDRLFEPLRLREDTPYDFAVTLPLSLSEAEQQREHSRGDKTAWPFCNSRLAPVVTLSPTSHWHASGVDGTVKVFGTLNFHSFVGIVDLSVDEHWGVRAEVACSKVTYFDDFKALLISVSQDLIELLFQVDSASGFQFGMGEPVDVSPAVELFHLRRLMSADNLPLAFDTIFGRPHSHLIVSTHLVPSARARRIDTRQVVQMAPRLPFMEGGAAADLFWGRTPLALPEQTKHESLDTAENRFVKAFLEDLSSRVYRLEAILLKERKATSLREVRHWRDIIDEWLSWSSWREVGILQHIPSNSQVLQQRIGYREVLEAVLTLDYAMCLPWEPGLEQEKAYGDIRPIFRLYEYWCYFVLRKALRDICGEEVSGELYPKQDGRLHFNVKAGGSSKLRFDFLHAGHTATVWLFFKRRFSSGKPDKDYKDNSYSTPFDPDYSILIANGKQKHWLHFDAKYRLNMENWRRQIATDTNEDSDEGTDDGGAKELYKRDDLYKMHAYRDAILGTRGAYVLFPSTMTNEFFVRHRERRYRSRYKVPGVGAFALQPQSEAVQVKRLAAFLKAVFIDLIAPPGTYQEEDGLP